jgi:hypothetical protein
LVSEVVKRRGVHLKSEEKLLEKCGIVGGVASKVKNIGRSCCKSEKSWEELLQK